MTNTTDRKPRILWASVNCLLDSSSGASMSVRQMLRQLVAADSDIRIIGATIFDALSGRSHFEGDWSALQAGFMQKFVAVLFVSKKIVAVLFVPPTS